MRVPTTEYCPTCAAETPEKALAKHGRVQNRLYQDLDTGKFVCNIGHEIDLTPERPAVAEESFTPPARVQEMSDKLLREHPEPQEVAKAPETSVAVAEPEKSRVLPGTGRLQKDGTLHMNLIIPEVYSVPLMSYCESIGRDVESYINEIVQQGFENGWFL